jgi:hypothetical protein
MVAIAWAENSYEDFEEILAGLFAEPGNKAPKPGVLPQGGTAARIGDRIFTGSTPNRRR